MKHLKKFNESVDKESMLFGMVDEIENIINEIEDDWDGGVNLIKGIMRIDKNKPIIVGYFQPEGDVAVGSVESYDYHESFNIKITLEEREDVVDFDPDGDDYDSWMNSYYTNNPNEVKSIGLLCQLVSTSLERFTSLGLKYIYSIGNLGADIIIYDSVDIGSNLDRDGKRKEILFFRGAGRHNL